MIIRKLNLQPLRIPAGWSVEINHFYDLEPIPGHIEIRDKRFNETDGWKFFEQTLLFMMNARFDRRNPLKLDLGWVPYYSPDGRFVLTLFRGEDWNEPILTFETPRKAELVEKINSVLEEGSLHGWQTISRRPRVIP